MCLQRLWKPVRGKGWCGVVSLCGTVKAPMFFQTTANTSIRMVNEEGGSCAACKGQWSRGWLRCRGIAVLCTHGGFLNLLEDEGL